MTTTDEIKEAQRRSWGAVAAVWDAHAEWVDRNFAPITDWLCSAVGLGPRTRLLDVACGIGEPALVAAARIGGGGSVVAGDLSPDMIAVVARRAAERGLHNVETRAIDAEQLPFADASFDAATCGFGLMFCIDPARGAAEIRRVLVPGGRCAVAVWDEPRHNPYFTSWQRGIAQVIPQPPADPDAPGPFRLATSLRGVLERGGFADIAVERVGFAIDADSPQRYVDFFTAMARAQGTPASRLGDADRDRLHDLVFDAIAPFATPSGGVSFPASVVCARATSPS
jgi:SAM-dependent methyltransferase